MVMERFPKWEKERTCRMERSMRNAARESYYKRLVNERKREADILEGLGASEANSGEKV